MIADLMTTISDIIMATVGGPWLYPLVLAITMADAFLIIVPSETVVVALGAVALPAGQPEALILIGVAALGAMIGDSLTYWIARRTDISRFRWARGPRTTRALETAFGALHRRAISVLLTARFIPFGRVIVNLSAGSSRFPYPRFLLLTAMSSTAWATYSVLIGALFGQLFGGNTLFAVVTSVVAAVTIGFVIDTVVQRITAIRSPGPESIVDVAPAPAPAISR